MYNIRLSLKSEIESFSKNVIDFANGEIEAVKFKAIRVPMGIYEQRRNNTFMVRVRCAVGMITPMQLKEVALLAQMEGAEPIHITTRQELQLHNVRLDQTPYILEKLFTLGLSSRGGGGNTVRNIIASEDAGISKDEIFDVTPYALAMTNTLIAESDSWLLPRKYKIAFAGNDADNANATFSDLGFIATIQSGERGFKVYVGGGLGSKPTSGFKLTDFLPEEDILYIGEALKLLFSEHGNRRNRHKARIRFIFYKLGKDRVFELLWEIFNRLKSEKGYELNLPQIDQPTLKGKEIDYKLYSDAFGKWLTRYVKSQKQKNLYSVEVPFEHGMVDAGTLVTLSEFLLPLGKDVIRFTRRQNILLRNIPAEQLEPLYILLRDSGVKTDKPRILNSLVACTGADTCRLGLCLAKGASSALRAELSKLDEQYLDSISNIDINFSGCPNSCGQHSISQLGFCGKVSRNDRDAIVDLQKGIEHAYDQEFINKSLHGILFHASRMLLVTRGVEPKNRDEVFTSFIEAFINEGYISSKFETVIRLTLINPEVSLLNHHSIIKEFAFRVIDLYNNMDDSLQFKGNHSNGRNKELKPASAHGKRIKDFRGVACPMNFVRTKIELSSMKSGELLEILLDDGNPIKNVPGSVRNEGHQILDQKRNEDWWTVLIQKA